MEWNPGARSFPSHAKSAVQVFALEGTTLLDALADVLGSSYTMIKPAGVEEIPAAVYTEADRGKEWDLPPADNTPAESTVAFMQPKIVSKAVTSRALPSSPSRGTSSSYYR